MRKIYTAFIILILVFNTNNTYAQDAGPNQTVVCDYAYLSATPYEDGYWTTIAPGVLLVNSNYENTVVQNLNYGGNEFTWNMPDYGESYVTITRIKADAGVDQAICGNSVNGMNANTAPTGMIGLWAIISGGGIIQMPSNNVTAISNLYFEQNNTFRWTVSFGGCTDFDDIDIYAYQPVSANAGADIEICYNYYSLYADFPEYGTGVWSSSNNAVVIQDASNNMTQVYNYPVGSTTFFWTVSNGPCVASDDVIITKYEAPAPTINGPASVCAYQSLLYYSDYEEETNYDWNVYGGSFYPGQNPNEINVNWDNSNSIASIELFVTYPDGCSASRNYPVTVELENKPIIIPKGENLLICLDSGMVNYQWFVNETPLNGENRQFYYSENLTGNYFVETTSTNNCIWKSDMFYINPNNIKLFPNPVSDVINIEIKDTSIGIVIFSLKDLTGKTIKNFETNKTSDILKTQIPINEIKTGVYTLNVLINNKLYSSGRLVVQ
ncbi:MAG: T9SS type A sorting domain-containing protein [Bacteroidales bacterium]|nr:T9SS type A sorting domain-containing protein [Bacteroidales bacterium]MBN2758248.1 T9SS type A sorting domain-containing protein [Bacteroidales bacterium]